MAIDVETPGSPGWWLDRLYVQLRLQQKYCQRMHNRYSGNPPLPFVTDIQRDAVKWFVEKSRTNFERLIVTAVLSRLKIRGIRTAVNDGEAGDAEAFQTWRRAHGKLVSLDAHKWALAMSRSYVIVGQDESGQLLMTAEDPRQVTAITDPADPTKVIAALKLYYDTATEQDVAYLYLPGEIWVAKRDRAASMPVSMLYQFHPEAFYWDVDVVNDSGQLTSQGASQRPPWLQAHDGLPALCPVVEFLNEDGMAEFEPFEHLLDRINQQILQRMTIATVQAFKQRAFKGLPQKDPKTGEDIDYDSIFVADPGAIWNIPASVEIWESGQVDLQPILLAIRDDIRDLAAVSGTPLYTITPDAANGSAEGASLQREQMTFKVESRQDRWEVAHEKVAELIFRTLGDDARAEPGTVEIMWAPADRPSMSERANAIAQTKGVIPRYQQLTEIWGMDPGQADRAMSQLTQDMVLDQQFAAAAPGAGPAEPAPPSATPNLRPVRGKMAVPPETASDAPPRPANSPALTDSGIPAVA